MIELVQKAIFPIVVAICVYGVIDRICACFEKCCQLELEATTEDETDEEEEN